MDHPKHKSLYFDEISGKWCLKHKRGRSKHRCPVAWCKNVPRVRLRRGRITIDLYCSKCASRRKRANNPVNYAFHAIKDSAKKRGISFSISYRDFKEWCERTGYAKDKGFVRLTHHCDRIRHNEGYHIDNIQLLTERENIQKRNTDLAQDELDSVEQEDESNPF